MDRTHFKYRCKRDCYFAMRRFRLGDVRTFDVEVLGVPPHHFEALDGGPVGKAADGSRWAKVDAQAAARRKMSDDSQEPETLHGATRSKTPQKPSADTPGGVSDAEPPAPALPAETPSDFDDLMKFAKPVLIGLAKREGKSTHGSKADISRRILGLTEVA